MKDYLIMWPARGERKEWYKRNMECKYDMVWVLLKVFMIKGLKYGKGCKKPPEKKKSKPKPNKNQTRWKQSWLPREYSTLDHKVQLQSRQKAP